MKGILTHTIVILAAFSIIPVSFAFNIGAKGRSIGPTIHTAYFLTPNNQAFDVRAIAYVGTWANGQCQYQAQYDIGKENLKTGDFVDIDAYQLRSVVGGGYSCISIYYTYKQLVIETLQLVWDGTNYTNSTPAVDELTIL